MAKRLHRILVRGGILSPGELRQVISLAEALGLDGIHFGSRQDILFHTNAIPAGLLDRYPQLRVEPLEDSLYANVVCSYVSSEIFPRTGWLTGATYLYILEQFAFEPRLEINLTDPRQRLVPLFTGHVNFIASEEEDFWFVYLQLPGWAEMVTFPALVHSYDLGRFAEAVESASPAPADVEALVADVNRVADLNLRGLAGELRLPYTSFPYYEGMNRIDGAQYWLGLYWRDNHYDLAFLRAACDLCLAHRIGKLCITPWKSLIINGIPAERRFEWDRMLGRLGINARHSSLELNWHLPVGDEDALALKRYLVREFDQLDISTYGLTFGVSGAYSRPFTTIVIDREGAGAMVDGFAVRPSYTLRHARDFDPNTREYVAYARRVDRAELTELILELSRLYFEQVAEGQARGSTSRSAPHSPTTERLVWRCGACGSAYDPLLGDDEQGVAPGTAFAELPAGYACWTCGGKLAGFAEATVEMEVVQVR